MSSLRLAFLKLQDKSARGQGKCWAMLVECQECGRSVSDQSDQCVGCGAPKAAFMGEEQPCLECGNPVTLAMASCQECGAPKWVNERSTQTKNDISSNEPIHIQKDRSISPLGRGRTNWGLWARFFAKYIDIAILFIPAAVIAAPIVAMVAEANGLYYSEAPVALTGLVILVAFAFLEAVQVSAFKSTIGKSLFGIEIESQTGGRLALGYSLRRSIMSFIRGLGLGIPLISLFTCSAAYSFVKNEGATGWDDAARANYRSSPVNKIRWTMGGILFVAAVMWIVLLSVAGMEDGY